jgi:uncharacterized protein (TIGR04255 family)
MLASKPLLHPPLSEVAFEISFPRQFLVENRIAEFQQSISASYPNSSDEFMVRLPPSVGFGKPPRPGGALVTPVRTFVFQNQGGTRSVKASVVNVNFVVTDYRDFDDYKSALLVVLSSAIRIFELRRIERFGLRYVNRIPIPRQTGPMAFRNYVRPPIDLSFFDAHTLANFLLEARLDLEGEKKLTIRGGLLPLDIDDGDYTYLLDLDSYSDTPRAISQDDLPSILDDYHQAIEAEFRRSMTDRYWKYLEKGEAL